MDTEMVKSGQVLKGWSNIAYSSRIDKQKGHNWKLDRN